MKSWKTTSTGILAVLGAAVGLYYQRHGLTPEIIMAATSSALTGIGLILARDNDKSSEDVGAKPPAPSARTGVTGLLMILTLTAMLAVGLSVGLTGCQAPPQRVAFNAVSAPAMTADQAMQVWGDYVAQFHPPAEQEMKVLEAFRNYKAAELEAIDDAHMAANAMGSTNLTGTVTTQLQSPEASQALSDLVSLIRQFGGKL